MTLDNKITCEDCGEERMVTKACAKTAKRCKSCQKEFNRVKARDRYRISKGLPLDGPIQSIIKKKKVKEVVQEVRQGGIRDAWGNLIVEKTKSKVMVPTISEEEQNRRNALLSELLDKLEDKSTVDDW